MEDFVGKEIPKLGFGLMRLPQLEDGSVDIEQTKDMVDAFLAAGMTYFDTAFVYGKDGASEKAAKAALVDRYPRGSFQLATKLNAWMQCDNAEQARRQLEISLERTGAGYFDYYLLHCVDQDSLKKYDDFGIWDFVKEQKAAGKIRHWGFSFHDTADFLDRVLTEHPDAEFVQLQINYADWESAAVQSRLCYETARRHGKGVIVMEPVKGGTLAQPPQVVRDVLTAGNAQASPASWAIRFAASLEGIITVLSGMSSREQMADNLSYMKDFTPLSAQEKAVIGAAQEALAGIRSVPCTGCHYCTEGCPMQIPIPDIFSARNRQLIWEQDERAHKMYERAVGKEGAGKASDCIACGQCEGACPQQIPIIEWLKDCAEALE